MDNYTLKKRRLRDVHCWLVYYQNMINLYGASEDSSIVSIELLRSICTYIGLCLRSIPTKALFAILNWLLSDLGVEKKTSLMAVKFNAVGLWPQPCGGKTSCFVTPAIVYSRILKKMYEHLKIAKRAGVRNFSHGLCHCYRLRGLCSFFHSKWREFLRIFYDLFR